MRKNVFGRHFKRDKNERTALFKGLISSLILHERIKTTEDKAKAIRADIDRIITKAKKGGPLARHLLQKQLPKKEIEKVILEIAPRFKERQGGYTRIIKTGRRFSDNAPMVLMEWTQPKEVQSSKFKVQSSDEKTATTETQKIATIEPQSREAGSGSARKKTETQRRAK